MYQFIKKPFLSFSLALNFFFAEGSVKYPCNSM